MCPGNMETAGFNPLIETALKAGDVISSKEIVVRDDLAALCGASVRCTHWGLSRSCPPHVDGPKGIIIG